MAFAFVIPVHPPHFHYLYQVFDQMRAASCPMDTYLVFSSEDDRDAFQCSDANVHKLVCDAWGTDPLTCGARSSIATCKKFFALRRLMETTDHEYFIACDAEMRLIPENFTPENVLRKCQAVFRNGVIYGGVPEAGAADIVRESARVFSDSENDQLEAMTRGHAVYTWWSDMPVYKRSTLPLFFDTIDCARLLGGHFDHLIYQFFLLLHCGFRICDCTVPLNLRWSLEMYATEDPRDLAFLKAEGYGFGWAAPRMFSQQEAFLKAEGTFMLYHLDRW